MCRGEFAWSTCKREDGKWSGMTTIALDEVGWRLRRNQMVEWDKSVQKVLFGRGWGVGKRSEGI